MGDILLDHVSFTYKNGYEAVSDVTLSIRQGESCDSGTKWSWENNNGKNDE